MRNKRIAVILVLLVAFSSPVFSNQDTCLETEEYFLGRINGKASIGFGWVLINAGLPTLGVVIGSGVARVAGKDDYIGVGHLGGMIASLFAPFLLFQQQPKTIPAHFSEEQLECYLLGYQLRVVQRQAGMAIMGVFLGGMTAGMVALFLNPDLFVINMPMPLF